MRARRVAVAAALLAAGSGAYAALSTADPPSFGFDLQATRVSVAEPTIGVLPDGTLVLQARQMVLASRDGGDHWSTLYSAPVKTTFDPFLHVDETTGRIFSSQLYTACQTLALSSNLGRTWGLSTQCAPIDHQKLGSGPWAAEPPPLAWERLVYTCFNRIADTACSTSHDGGYRWLPPVTVFVGHDPAAQHTLNIGICGGLLGDPKSGPDGTIYVPREFCGRPFLAVSQDNGLTWLRHWVAEPAETRPVGFAANNPAVAVDAVGTVYYAWTGADWKPYVARSDDHGRHWTQPWNVAPNLGTTTFPLIVAGDGGRVATAFLGTMDTADGPDTAPIEARWHLYVAFSMNADAPEPAWSLVQVTPDDDPVMMGCIGRHGHLCPNKNLLDFNGIALTPDGRVVIAFTDGCVGCTGQADSTSDEGVVAVQVAGPRLR